MEVSCAEREFRLRCIEVASKHFGNNWVFDTSGEKRENDIKEFDETCQMIYDWSTQTGVYAVKEKKSEFLNTMFLNTITGIY